MGSGTRKGCSDVFILCPRSAAASVPTVYCLPALPGMLCTQASSSQTINVFFLTAMLGPPELPPSDIL